MRGVIYMVSGKIRSGKDYVSDILVNNFGFTKYAFADKLKQETSESCNIDLKYFSTQFGKASMSVYGKTYRQLLIDQAEYKKMFDKNYYTKVVVNQIEKSGIDKIVISDFRYPYEYDFMREKLGSYYDIRTINVQREGSLVTKFSSENALCEFEYDLIIDNNKDSNHVQQQLFSGLKV